MRKKLIRAATAAGTVVTSLGAMASGVSAQDTAGDAAGGLFCCGYGFFTICMSLFGLAYSAFAIWMLIDALQRDEKVLPGKVKWALVIFFVPFGAVAYFFMRKKTLDAAK